MNRLDQFLDVDDAARDRAARISSFVGLGGFLLAKFVLDINGKALGYTVIGAVACAYLARLWWYCQTSDRQPIQTENRFLVPRRFAMAAASAGMFALFLIAPPRVIEAAVLDRRLRALTRELPLSPEQAKGIADVLITASNGTVSLPSETLALVRDAIKTSEPDSTVANAARALLRYNGDVNRPVLINPPRNDAQRAFLEGGEHFLNVIPPSLAPINTKEANAAVLAFSRAVQLAGTDQSLRIDALLERALLYNLLGEPSEALADAETAEKLGALDLSSIISIETSALLARKDPNDLKQVISLATLGLQIRPPKWLLADAPRMETIYGVELLQKRATAYYALGEFAKAAEDCRTALGIAPPRAVPVNFLFSKLIASYVSLGNMKEALAAADEWQRRTGNPSISVVRDILNLHRADPVEALNQLDRIAPVQ